MPHNFTSWWGQLADALIFAGIGVIIGFAQCMRERERDLIVIVGRSICTGGLAAAAGVVLIWWPDLPFVGLVGVAAALASIGTSALEKIAARYLEKKAEG